MADAEPRLRTCPRADCLSPIVLATRQQLRDGARLWTCDGGHGGPRFIGFEEDGNRSAVAEPAGPR